MKYSICSYSATTYSLGCFPYILLRCEFERAVSNISALQGIERSFNRILLRLGKSFPNEQLTSRPLFDAVELHLTDPRIFYDPLEWRINETMVEKLKCPVASFHAHVESDPLVPWYVFNLSDNVGRTRKSIRSQLETGYKIMHIYPGQVKADNPVFVFHPGVARNEADKHRAFLRTRENIEYIAIVNNELYRKYGCERKLIPTIENSARDNLSLCQSVEEWIDMVRGFEGEVKLTLDYGHIQTVKGEKDKLLNALRSSDIGRNIISMHLHYSPMIDNERQHAHGALSKIPEDSRSAFENDIATIVAATGLREQGYVTLEVFPEDPSDYMPSLKYIMRHVSIANRIMKATGLFDWRMYRGTYQDLIDSLRLMREIIDHQDVHVNRSIERISH
ncbi:MAG: TIM barrel protein [Chloroflexota bacterium]|nr:TIM barrel protein [Chloroflexota bacterium]